MRAAASSQRLAGAVLPASFRRLSAASIHTAESGRPRLTPHRGFRAEMNCAMRRHQCLMAMACRRDRSSYDVSASELEAMFHLYMAHRQGETANERDQSFIDRFNARGTHGLSHSRAARDARNAFFDALARELDPVLSRFETPLPFSLQDGTRLELSAWPHDAGSQALEAFLGEVGQGDRAGLCSVSHTAERLARARLLQGDDLLQPFLWQVFVATDAGRRIHAYFGFGMSETDESACELDLALTGELLRGGGGGELLESAMRAARAQGYDSMILRLPRERAGTLVLPAPRSPSIEGDVEEHVIDLRWKDRRARFFAAVQGALADLGWPREDMVSGLWDRATCEALGEFQRREGLRHTGRLNPETAAALLRLAPGCFTWLSQDELTTLFEPGRPA
ncbi:MAG TPA: peptidoglycan-binding domain-containing protein [Ramlibacter sp.]|uniref:peptidoglycan-binding domain-containing protein n=1 Tax=Ramlibacter sp. TaxID=1917967 RepID=UPI002B5C7739|nr:peptidoglycan-binding domain-containing protein [Ramlibacter sp.]HVZ47117.1 peptidoglycan-binding domain-containing protein [Ramlibacter sp.]